MKKSREDRFKSKCWDFVRVNYPPVPHDRVIKADFSLSNSGCHHNAVAAVNAGREDKVWLAWGGTYEGVVHFINSKGGKFFDETWHDYDKQNYRLIREVQESEFEDVLDILMDTKRMMFNVNGSVIDQYYGRKKGCGWI